MGALEKGNKEILRELCKQIKIWHIKFKCAIKIKPF